MRNNGNDTPDWSGFCLVGFGNHASSRILPAIKEAKVGLKGIVSSKGDLSELVNTNWFDTVDEALINLDKNCCFYLCSPPRVHYEQAIKILHAGFDVLMEKPAFASLEEARRALTISRRKNAVLAECYMYRYSKIFIHFLENWNGGIDVSCLEISFSIPGYAQGSFRDNEDNIFLLVYDVGCYLVDLARALEIDISLAELNFRPNRGAGIVQFESRGVVKVLGSFGVGEEYLNEVTLHFKDGSKLRYAPFFYGRTGNRVFTRLDPSGVLKAKTFVEDDNFKNMLDLPKSFWISNRQRHQSSMLSSAETLEALFSAVKSAWLNTN